MRAGWVISFIGHVGAAMMSMLAWEATSAPAPEAGSVVPVDIVDIAAESNVRALAMPDDLTSDDPTTRSEHSAPDPAVEPAPSPAPRPTPPRQSNFTLADATNAIDQHRRATHERMPGADSDHNQRGAGQGTGNSAALIDLISSLAEARFRRCWDDVIDLPDPDRLVVTVSWELDRNGHLRGQPQVVSPRGYAFDAPMRQAVDRALRAVRRCDPLPFPDDPRVGSHYDLWRSGTTTFRHPGN